MIDNPRQLGLPPSKEIKEARSDIYAIALSINPHALPEQLEAGDLQPVALFAFDIRDPDGLPLLRPLDRLPIQQERVMQALTTGTPITELLESEPYLALTHPDMPTSMQSYLEHELEIDPTRFRSPAFSEISGVFNSAQRHDIGYHLLRKAHEPDVKNNVSPSLVTALKNTASMFLYSTGVTRHIQGSRQESFEAKYHGQFAADFGDFPIETSDLINVREHIVEFIGNARKSPNDEEQKNFDEMLAKLLEWRPSTTAAWGERNRLIDTLRSNTRERTGVKIMQDLEDMSLLWGEAFLYALEKHARDGGKTEIIIPPRSRIHPQAYPISDIAIWPVQWNVLAQPNT